jgi:hypothetical protein
MPPVLNQGKYLYGIIAADEARNFGPIGIGSQEVETISYGQLSAVISSVPLGKYELSKENLLAHQRVLERVMSEYTLLPVKFYTVGANAEEIRRMVEQQYRKLLFLLRDLEGKVELGVKAAWRDMREVLREVAKAHTEIRRLTDKTAARPSRPTYAQRIAIGEMVEAALEARRAGEAEEILIGLRRLAVDHRLNRTIGERMLLNAAFLVDRAREPEFDGEVDRLDHRHGGQIKFTYVGPVPPYNFVNITLRLAP